MNSCKGHGLFERETVFSGAQASKGGGFWVIKSHGFPFRSEWERLFDDVPSQKKFGPSIVVFIRDLSIATRSLGLCPICK